MKMKDLHPDHHKAAASEYVYQAERRNGNPL